MKHKLTFVLSWCLLLSAWCGVDSKASSHSLSGSDVTGKDLPSSNFPWSAEGRSNEIDEVPASNSSDFIIRRKVDFNNHPDGYYTDAQFRSDWNGGGLYSPNTTQIRTVDGKKVLANFYPKGTWGRGGGLNQWGSFQAHSDKITEIYWSFKIKYQHDFDWALGAKLPGIGFGPVQTVASGGAGPGIGNKGGTARLMSQAGGKLKLYVYHHGMGKKYGDDMGHKAFGQMKRGEWQELTVRVVANDNGKANGIMQVWLDGELVASVANIEMRRASSPQEIGGILLNTFMGGADSQFAVDRNQFMWMDDVHFWQYSDKYLAANPSVARGLKLHPASHKLYTPISGTSTNSNASPTVSVTSPKSDAQFAVGSNVSIAANAADSDGTVAKVEFYNGTTLLGTATRAPYNYTWSNVEAGDYSVTAKATDNKGATTTSGVVKIKVASNASPTISITSPSSNDQFAVGSTVSIAANAADSDGKITKVEFYNGATLLGTDTSAPYSYTWTNVKSGVYSLTAKATDNKGASTVSDVVGIEVGATKPADKNESVSPKPGAGSKFLNGLVSFYEMNTNTSGVLRDSHGNNHGKSTSISHVNGFKDKGNRYDGKASISQVPHSSSLNLTTEFTLMADVYREGPGQFSGSVIVGKTYSSAWPENEAYSIAITEDNKIRIRTNIGMLKDWVSTKTVPQGKWVRIIATYKSGEGYSLYLDTTTPEKTGKFSGSIYQSNQGLTIGASQAGYRRRVQGILDNVGIWNRQLSHDEIAELITTDASYPDFVSASTNANPTVTLTSPTSDGQSDVGSVISIAANATDIDGTIAKVEFYNGNTLLGTATRAPYSYNWTNVKAGDYSITAKATDNKGAATTSSVVKIKVVSNASPTVMLTSPKSNGQFAVGSSVSIAANAADSDGTVAKVEFYNGTTLLGTTTRAPYSYNWTNVKAGDYSITAKVTDNKGATNTSSVVKIKVASNAAPKVSITSPKSDSQFAVGSTVSITATAADSDGKITKVEFYNGTTLLGTDTSAPYSYTWTNVKVGAYSITAKATDDKGATTTSNAVKIPVVKDETVSSKPGAGAKFLNGLVSFYEMNTNTSGSLRDSHGNNHGKSTSISHVNGFEEKGNRYDGKSSISKVPHSSSLNLTTEFTLMADVYREGPGQFSGSVIVGKTYSSAWPENEAYSMAITADNKIRIRTNIGMLKDWVSTKTVPQGKWVRIIATYKSGEGYSLYLDTTTPEKTGKLSGSIYQSNQGLTIGASQAGYRRRVQGILDNVGIWNRQLSQAEIAELITTDASYPDFVGGQTYRITMATATDELVENVTEGAPIEAEAGEKMVFFVEEEQKGEAEFDYWSVDGVQVSDEALFELDMPERDITLTKHFKTSEALEVKGGNTPSADLPQVRLDYAIGPNPAMDHLNIMFTNLDGDYEFLINVVSMTGSVKKTLTVRPEGSGVTIDVSDLTNGVYVLQLNADGHAVASKKFIKL
jgi:hypothetical protein